MQILREIERLLHPLRGEEMVVLSPATLERWQAEIKEAQRKLDYYAQHFDFSADVDSADLEDGSCD